MGTIDIVILVVLGAGLVRGAFQGVIRQIGALVGMVLGVIGCNLYGSNMTSLMSEWFPALLEGEYGGTIVSVLSHILLFVLIYWGVLLVAKLLKSITSALALGFFDKILGAIFCAVKYILVLSIILNIWFIFFPTGDAGVNAKLMDGELYRSVYEFAPWLLDSEIIPQSKELIKSVAV